MGCEIPELLLYKEKTGNCLVPQKYGADPELGGWVGTQRKQFRQGTLRDDRKAKRDHIGFVYNVPEEDRRNFYNQQWEELYQELVEFRRTNGHCRVPCQRKARNTRCKTLSSWVNLQRTRRSISSGGSGRKYRPLSQEEIDKLDKLGFVWKADNYAERWNDKFERLKIYTN